MKKMLIALVVLGCFSAQSKLQAFNIPILQVRTTLQAMDTGGPAVQAEKFTGGKASNQSSSVQGSENINSTPPLAAPQPRAEQKENPAPPASSGSSNDSKPTHQLARAVGGVATMIAGAALFLALCTVPGMGWAAGLGMVIMMIGSYTAGNAIWPEGNKNN